MNTIEDKIKALIRKAESSEYEGESEAFAAAAARLALKNAIDLASLDTSHQDDFGEYQFVMDMAYRKDKLQMLNGMARVVGVYCYYLQATDKLYVTLIGRKRVIDSLWITFLSLSVQMDSAMLAYVDPATAAQKEWGDFWIKEEYGDRRSLGAAKRRYRRQFAVGFSRAVIDRWREMKTLMEEEAPGSGLVLQDDYQRAKNSITVNLGKSRTSIHENAAGRLAGGRADLGGSRLPTNAGALGR